ncbi:SDR family oxidoreductase [Terrisporobacter petrolearius]|uniref:SDR family oxidoreductase n=1 Tax=Terrisporobacter petrolearius TaxID=1460447 RepID=UPI001D160F80
MSPGWIETEDNVKHSKKDKLQHPVCRVGKVSDIFNMVMFLCSEKVSFITGEDIKVDGGMSKLMIYKDDNGWYYSI